MRVIGKRLVLLTMVCCLGLVALSARVSMAAEKAGGLAGENANFGKDISLEGSRRGPTYFYMTKAERQAYVRYMKEHPEGREKFGGIRAAAEKALNELPKAPTGNWIDEVLWHNPGMALSRAYLVTGDRRHLDRASEMMARCANVWMERNCPLKGRQARGRGNSWIWGPGGGSLGRVRMRDGSTELCNWDMTWVVLAYDLVAADMPDADERVVRAFIKNACDGLVEWKHVNPPRIPGQGEGGNMAAQTIGHWSMYGFAIGYDAFTDWCISHSGRGSGQRDGGGLLQIIRGFRDRAIQGEAPAYWWYIGDGILTLAHCASRARDIDIWNMAADNGMRFRDVIDGRVALCYPVEERKKGSPGIRCSRWGEGGWDWLVHGTDPGEWLPGHRCARSRWEPILTAAYEGIRDKGYAWFMSLMPESAHRTSHRLPLDLSGFEPLPAPSRVFPNAGIAVLRADETPNYWMGKSMMLMIRGGEPMRSAPGDSFGIRLHGGGKMLYPDWNTATYEDYRQVGWARAAIRRSSVMIDHKECWRHRTIWRRQSYPEVKYLSLRASRYGNDRSERTFMMTKEYLLDVFDITIHDDFVPEMEFIGRPTRYVQYRDWSGASLHDENGKLPASFTFDWVLNAIGRELPLEWWAYQPSRQLSMEGWPNRYIEDEKRRDIADRPVCIDYRQDRCGVRLRMLGEAETTVFTAQPPSATRLAVVRRKGKEATFTALHEPYFDAPSISEFAYLHKPKPGDDPRVVGVKVTAPGYVDRLYVTLGLEGTKGEEGSEVDLLKRDKREIANLTLDWLFRKDADQVGQKEKWFAPDYDRTGWRKVNAGVNWQFFEKGYYGAAWYAKTVEPVELPAGKKVYLFFEGVDEDCWVYVDGKKVYERVAEVMGDLWDVPFLLDVTDVWTPGKPHQLVVKVRKMKYQTGIYWPVRLMTDAPPEKGPKPDPVVTATSRDDPNERVTFSGQAYLRDTGVKLIARGDVKSLCIWAPGLSRRKAFVLNGKQQRFRKVCGYLVYGDAPGPKTRPGLVIAGLSVPAARVFAADEIKVTAELWNFTPGALSDVSAQLVGPDREALGTPVQVRRIRKGRSEKVALSAKAPAAAAAGALRYLVQARYTAADAERTVHSSERNVVASLPAEIAFPQRYVNLDAKAGGKLIARIINRSNRKLSGAVTVTAGGAQAPMSTQEFDGLEARHCTDLAVDLKVSGAAPGTLVPVEVSVTIPSADGGRTVHRRTTRVAVGPVIEEVPATYEVPYYDHTAGMPGKLRPRPEWMRVPFEYFLVRAPGYTIRIDKFSGMSRWIADQMGIVRTSLARYPWGRMRNKKAELRRRPKAPYLLAAEGFAWTTEAKCLGTSTDADGNPVLRFSSNDGERELELAYTFTADAVHVRGNGGRVAVQKGFVDLSGEGCEFFVEDSAFGFRMRDPLPLKHNAPLEP